MTSLSKLPLRIYLSEGLEVQGFGDSLQRRRVVGADAIDRFDDDFLARRDLCAPWSARAIYSEVKSFCDDGLLSHAWLIRHFCWRRELRLGWKLQGSVHATAEVFDLEAGRHGVAVEVRNQERGRKKKIAG